jgi:hypothetical protein
VQRIEPLKTIRARISRAIRTSRVWALLSRPGDVERRSTVEVLGRVGVDISHQAIDVVVREMRAGIFLGDDGGEGRAVFVYFVQRCHGVLHAVVHIGHVATVGGPVLSGIETALRGELVLWQQVEGCQVQEDEVAAAVLVQAIDGVVDAVHVVRNGLVGALGVGDERVVAQIIGADPDSISGRILLAGEKRLACRGYNVLRVCDEGGQFVTFNIRERDCGRELARSDVIRAYSPRNSVVVELC